MNIATESVKKRILAVTHTASITYVEVNIKSRHPFVRKVAAVAGMWNFKAEVWQSLHWPTKLCIESLQLTLEAGALPTNSVLRLDSAPEVTQMRLALEKASADKDGERTSEETASGDSNECSITTGDDMLLVDESNKRDAKVTGSSVEVDGSSAACVSLSDGAAPIGKISVSSMADALGQFDRFKSEFKMRNLFFIRFDEPDVLSDGPQIMLPRTLHGLGLQGFGESVFHAQWWATQVVSEARLGALRFLVLAQCSFDDGQLQTLVDSVRHLEHLSLRYVTWRGTLVMPSTLLSIGFFPQSSPLPYSYSLRECGALFQIQTRLSENCPAALAFLDAAEAVSASIQRVSFEFVRPTQQWLPALDLESAVPWLHCQPHLCVFIGADELAAHPALRSVFPTVDSAHFRVSAFDFDDCPHWSDEARDFIRMTKDRKLLLR